VSGGNRDKLSGKFQCYGSGSVIKDWPLDHGSGIRDEKKIRIRILGEHPGLYFQELRNNLLGKKKLKFFDADPGSGMDKHPGSATLVNSGESLTVKPKWKNYADAFLCIHIWWCGSFHTSGSEINVSCSILYLIILREQC
jgi:hypothetical protein